jgi:thioredoxin 2
MIHRPEKWYKKSSFFNGPQGVFMKDELILLTCPQCGTKNRIPKNRLHDRPVCGRCRTPLPVGTYSDRPRDIGDHEFHQEVLTSREPVLVDFWGPHCAYCRMLAPVLDQIASNFAGRVKVFKINVEENPRTPSQYGIQGIPTLLLFKGGKPVDRLVGILSRDEIEHRLLPHIDKS